MMRVDERARPRAMDAQPNKRDGAEPVLGPDEELDWLMSLALDEQLSEAEAARLEELLAAAPAHVTDWQQWQAVDAEFRRAPRVLPPADFAAKFETRLLLWERRRKLRTGVLFGLAALALWLSALAGVIGLGAFFWANQAVWLGGAIHQVAFWWAAARQIGAALLSGLDVLLDAPQTWVVFLCYVGLAVAILAGWFVWLQRSLRLESVGNGS